jgi:hypothetical protein
MAHLIDKDAVVAEIEKKRDAALTRQRNLEAIGQVTVLNETLARELNRIISFINTLEVKEVDLKKDVKNWIENNQDAAGFYDNIEFAKHFFELGMRQSKNYNNNEE